VLGMSSLVGIAEAFNFFSQRRSLAFRRLLYQNDSASFGSKCTEPRQCADQGCQSDGCGELGQYCAQINKSCLLRLFPWPDTLTCMVFSFHVRTQYLMLNHIFVLCTSISPHARIASCWGHKSLFAASLHHPQSVASIDQVLHAFSSLTWSRFAAMMRTGHWGTL
jgi:hypothetical protein